MNEHDRGYITITIRPYSVPCVIYARDLKARKRPDRTRAEVWTIIMLALMSGTIRRL